MYLLDTNVLCELTKPYPSTYVKAFLSARRQEGATLFVSVLTFGEMRRGVLKLRHNGDYEQSAIQAQRLQLVREKYFPCARSNRRNNRTRFSPRFEGNITTPHSA